MGDAAKPRNVGPLLWTLLISSILCIVGFCTTSWQKFMDVYPRNSNNSRPVEVHIGLWDVCHCGLKSEYWYESAWFEATQAMITIGLILLSVALIITAAYVCLNKLFDKSFGLIVVLICSFSATAFFLIGFIIFGVETAKAEYGGGGLNFSFSLVVVSSAGCVLAGLLAVIHVCKN